MLKKYIVFFIITSLLLIFLCICWNSIPAYHLSTPQYTVSEYTDLKMVYPDKSIMSMQINNTSGEDIYMYIGNNKNRIEVLPDGYKKNFIYKLDETVTVNFKSDAGIYSKPTIFIGSYSNMQLLSNILLMQRMVTLGICICTIFYLISLFLHKKSEKYLILVCMIAYITATNSLNRALDIWYLKIFGLDILGLVLGRVMYVLNIQRGLTSVLCGILHIILYNIIFDLYSREKIKKIFYGIFSLFVLSIIFSNSSFEFEILNFILDISIYAIEIFMLINILCKDKSSKNILFAALIYISIIIGIFDSFMIFGIIPDYFANKIINIRSLQSLFYVFAFTYLTSVKFANKFSESEKLSLELEDINKNLENKVAEKTAQLDKSYQMLKNKQQEKFDLISSLAHNLKTPLFALMGYTDILKSQLPANSQSEKTINILYDNEMLINHIIQNIFTMARLENGKINLNKTVFSLNGMFNSITEASQQQLDRKNLKIKNISKDTVYYEGDFFYLKQAFQNIIDNAVRHSKNGGEIIIDTREEQDGIFIEITDFGEGIAQEDMDKIFTRNYSKHKDNRSSSGLGLTITKEIINLHSGIIDVNSKQNEYTSFIIKLSYLS